MLAIDRFAVEPRVMARLAAQRAVRLDDLVQRTFDETRGLDLALEMPGREVRPECMDTGIERHHGLVGSVAGAQHRIERAR